VPPARARADAIQAQGFGIAEDTAHWRMLCSRLWIASERALALDNFSHAVTLEAVQTLCVRACVRASSPADCARRILLVPRDQSRSKMTSPRPSFIARARLAHAPCRCFHQAPVLAMAIRLAVCIGLGNVAADKVGEVPPPGRGGSSRVPSVAR